MLAVLLLLPATFFSQEKTDSLNQLASDFWAWRTIYRPFTFDDIPRMERAAGVRDWSEAAVEKQRAELAKFENRWTRCIPTIGRSHKKWITG